MHWNKIQTMTAWAALTLIVAGGAVTAGSLNTAQGKTTTDGQELTTTVVSLTQILPAFAGEGKIAHMTFPQSLINKAGETLTFTVPAGMVRLDGFVGRMSGSSAKNTKKPDKKKDGFACGIKVNGEQRFATGPLPLHLWRRGVRFRVPVGVGDKVELTSETVSELTDLRIVWAQARLVDAVSADWSKPPADKCGIASTPPMGWNNWYALHAKFNESVILQTAQSMIDRGLRDAGYTIIGLDDGWQDKKIRETDGAPRYDHEKFPNGMRVLSDKLNAMGFKLGIYSRPAWVGKDNEDIAARTFALWNIALIKYDYSDKDGRNVNERVVRALRNAGSKAIFNVCEWGVNRPWEWGRDIGAQTWRTGYDLNDGGGQWETDVVNGLGVYTAAERNDIAAEYAGPGCWNDPDYLQVGFKGLTCDESRSQFGLWCLMAAPLTIATDVRTIKPKYVTILTNREAIAINQDPRGQQGVMVMRLGTQEAWAKPLVDGSLAVGLLNRGPGEATVECDFRYLGLNGKYRVRDVWAGRDDNVTEGKIARTLPSHGMALLRLTRDAGEQGVRQR